MDMGDAGKGFEQMWTLVGQLPQQLEQAWQVGAPQVAPRDVRSVLVCGMGGSAVAAELVGSILDPAQVRIEVVRGYALEAVPAPETLLVFSSYSGNTEETLAAWEDALARARNCPRVVISSGGELSDRAAAAGVPRIALPGGLPPRASLGSGVGALCAVLEAAGEPGLAAQVPATVAVLESGNRRWGLDGRAAEDQALALLADHLQGKLPVLYSGCRLTHAVSRRWRAQLNENAKLLATRAELPELDHNEVVGWGQPTAVRLAARVIALRDEGDHPRVARRFAATQELLKLDDAAWFERTTVPGPPLARMMGLVQEGDVLSCLLARGAGVDPVPVDVIDRLKVRLAGD